MEFTKGIWNVLTTKVEDSILLAVIRYRQLSCVQL